MSKTFHGCKNCNNQTSGDAIYKCDKCGKIYCSACLPNSRCGKCKNSWGIIFSGFTRIGTIK